MIILVLSLHLHKAHHIPDEVPLAKEALEALEAYGMGPLFLRLQFVSATPPFLLMAPFQRAFGLGTVGVKY